MGSKGKSEHNKTYYAENCEDILYRKRDAWKQSATINCPCGEHARYKDHTGSRNRHFKTLGHIIWLKKKKIIELLALINKTQYEAEQAIALRIETDKAKTNKAIMTSLNKLIMECINLVDNKGKHKPKPKPKAAREPEPEPEPEPFDPSVPQVPPSADFDPLGLAIPTPPPRPEPEAPKAYLSKKPLPADFDLNKLL